MGSVWLCAHFHTGTANIKFRYILSEKIKISENLKSYIPYKTVATIQGRAKQSCLTWSGIAIRKIPPHHTTTCPFTIQSYSIICQLYCTTSYDVVRHLTRSRADSQQLYIWMIPLRPVEILSHFYVRQRSESPILTILEAL